jgi:type I restriction enzyme S subunit
VEALLARVNAARARLARAPALLIAFRQAILSAACSGKLTEDWREKRTDTRRDAIASGMDATTWPSDWSDMELPHGWRWAHLPEIADCRLGKMLDKAKNSGTPTKYLRNINVRWFEFDLSDLLELKLEPEERAKYLLKNGDVLICEGGEPGRAAVWTGGKTDLVFQKALHRVRFISGVNAAWLVYCLRNDADSNRLETLFTGSTIKHLTGKALDQYPLALPPSIEQDEIVRRVMALFALADAIEAKMAAARKRADALTQAILAKAFRGELVPTEAALARAEGRPYESAGELLLRTPSQEQTKANPGRGNSQRRR